MYDGREGREEPIKLAKGRLRRVASDGRLDALQLLFQAVREGTVRHLAALAIHTGIVAHVLTLEGQWLLTAAAQNPAEGSGH